MHNTLNDILTRIETKVDFLINFGFRGLKTGGKIMANLDALKAQVAETLTVERSAVVLIEGLAAKLAEAGTDPVALAALQTDLKASADALAAAVAANPV